MLTVLEAARLVGRDPETVRRWIRSGRLPARKVGLQFLVEEVDLPGADAAATPAGWGRTATGEPMPDVVTAVRRSRTRR